MISLTHQAWFACLCASNLSGSHLESCGEDYMVVQEAVTESLIAFTHQGEPWMGTPLQLAWVRQQLRSRFEEGCNRRAQDQVTLAVHLHRMKP